MPHQRCAVLCNTQVRVRRRDFFNIVRYNDQYYHLVREAISGNEHDRRAHGGGEALDACDVESSSMHLCPSCHGRWKPKKDEERQPAAASGQRADGTWLVPAGFFAKNAPKGSVASGRDFGRCD